MRRDATVAVAVLAVLSAAPAWGAVLAGAIHSSTGKLPLGLQVVAESPDNLPDVIGKVDGDRYRIEVPDVGRIRLKLKAPNWQAPTKYIWEPKVTGALDFLVYPAKLPQPALAAELIAMGKEDQAIRDSVPQASWQDAAFVKRLNNADQARERRLSAIVDAGGWPAVSQVGDEAATSAWLIAQHGSPAFLKRCLPLMQAAADRLEMPPSQLALSIDRVLRQDGKPQRYGSQFSWVKDGKPTLDPIEDREHVDERRAAMGMESLATYISHFDE